MSASITVSGLSWSTPDGSPVLDALDLTFIRERTGIVGRNGAGKTTLLRLVAGELTLRQGRITINGTCAKLRQIVVPDAEETIATLFGVTGALAVLDRAEQGLASMDELAEADWTLPARLESALASVALAVPLTTRFASLSGGQRTRAAFAAAILAKPDFLLLDEPTNHLDRAGRTAVIDVLEQWRGGALVVSHDRDLLMHMDSIVELSSLGARRYGGNWSDYRARQQIEREAAEHDLAIAQRQSAELARKTQAATERKQRRDGAGARKGAKGDMPRIVAGMRRNQAEASARDADRMAERQRTQADYALAQARERIEVLDGITLAMPPTGLHSEKRVLVLDRATVGHVPARPVLRDLSLAIVGPERVALTGANGSGKSTLLGLASGALEPWSGTVMRSVPAAMLDQNLSLLDQQASVADNFARLHPSSDANACRAALARFGLRGDAALKIVRTVSGGQALRAALACVLGAGAPPQLLILDEPTNHLDLDSLAVVEAGLRAYDGALLVVSHEEAFLDAIGTTRRIAL